MYDIILNNFTIHKVAYVKLVLYSYVVPTCVGKKKQIPNKVKHGVYVTMSV